VPTEIADVVEAVFGLNESVRFTRGLQRPPHQVFPKPAAAPLTPVQVATAYQFPAFATGVGQSIGLVELGGGFLQTDIDTFFAGLGVASPAITIGGGTNNKSADGEVTGDIEVAGAAAPGAALVLYFAPDALLFDGVGAVQTAVPDSVNNPTVISLSWGLSEDTFGMTDMYRNGFDGLLADAGILGITVCVASGDDGAADAQLDGNPHVDFPASSPHVLACGGTELRLGKFGILETAWNDSSGATGGGISTVFPVPSYQIGVGLPPNSNREKGPGRGVPDVAANAAEASAYSLFIGGAPTTVWGTSLSAPLWAALIARLNEAVGFQVGFINPHLYALRGSKAFTDIRLGNNDVGNDFGGYPATPGWDCCTGLGTPVGTELVNAFGSSSLTQFFAPNQITCGYALNGLLMLDKADTVPITVRLRSDKPAIVSVPPVIVIPPGSSSFPVTFTAPAIQGPFEPKQVNVHASVGLQTVTTTATVVPPRIVSASVSPDTVISSQGTQLTVTLDRPSVDGPVMVELFCGDPGYAVVPANLRIDQDHMSATVPIMTPDIQVPFDEAHVSILAIYRSSAADPGTSATCVLTVKPQVVVGIVKAVVLTPTTITDGFNSYGTVTLKQAVPTDTSVAIVVQDPLANPFMPGSGPSGVSVVPSSVNIQAGHLQGTFTIRTSGLAVPQGHQVSVKIVAMSTAVALPVTATLTIEG
jgi:kumamolisin